MISMRMVSSRPLGFVSSDRLLESCCRRVAGVWGAMGFDEQQVGLVLGNRPMLDAFWHDVEIAGLGMRMPDKLALDFDDHHVMPVELGDDLWRPVLRKGVELLRKTYGR